MAAAPLPQFHAAISLPIRSEIACLFHPVVTPSRLGSVVASISILHACGSARWRML
jgi:hypothetical protein